ncbi:glycosyl transferase family 90 [Pararhodobacter sp.]|uniref:glycosyl transferase family 90 n=1 Tax=Pararhodobacter sp. TaxID=2127056 RepID=UPI002FE31FFB
MDFHHFICPSVHPETARLRADPRLLSRFPALMGMVCDLEAGRIVFQEPAPADGSPVPMAETDTEAALAGPEPFGAMRQARRQHQMVTQMAGHGARWFVSNMHDSAPFAPELYFGAPANLFQYTRRRGDRSAVLWRLDGYYEPSPRLGSLPEGEPLRDDLPFLDKRPRVVWRGNWTGITWTSPHGFERLGTHLDTATLPRHYPRAQAVLLSLEDPDLLDCRFVAGAKVRRKRGSEAPLGALEDRKRGLDWLLRNRYQLCLPGNDVATQLYWVIGSNSLALKVETEFEVIVDYFLAPWVHYVPIARDLSDLRDKIAYCEANPALCLAIIERANEAHARMQDARLWAEAEGIVLDRLGLLT